MRISRVQIENFRNFKHLDVETGSHLVIVGENKVGKSNFLHALRLILDPSLPDSARRLRIDDFWDGAKPLDAETAISISVDLTDFEDNPNHIALLSDYLIEHSPMVSRLTYAFFPKHDLETEPSKESDYDFSVYGADSPERLISSDVRRRLPLDLLPALRDAESDLSSWRRSPLRPLLDSISSEMDDEEKLKLASEVSKAAAAIAKTTEVESLGSSIDKMMAALAGTTHAVSTSLSISPSDANQLIRTLRIFVDGGVRSISDASLGSSNLIYLALKLLSVELEIKEKIRDHGFLAIEEPEAHLHPHVQRRVFRSFLRPRSHIPAEPDDLEPERTILLTTHSPHIASVTPIDSLVLLRANESPSHSTAHSVLSAGLNKTETDDIERYLDVTRGEILFARGVILVEGDAEEYLVPTLAKLIGYDFDELGISVCSVSGTNFVPYVKLLGKQGLGIPFSIITDEDPVPKKKCLAHNRVRKIVEALYPEDEFSDETESLFEEAEACGVFVTDDTLEIALYHCDNHVFMSRAIIQLSSNIQVKRRATTWKKDPDLLDEIQFLKDIKKIGKGRYAQRLSTIIKGNRCPKSIKNAIKYVVKKL